MARENGVVARRRRGKRAPSFGSWSDKTLEAYVAVIEYLLTLNVANQDNTTILKHKLDDALKEKLYRTMHSYDHANACCSCASGSKDGV